jgi:hypothetical protein
MILDVSNLVRKIEAQLAEWVCCGCYPSLFLLGLKMVVLDKIGSTTQAPGSAN